MRDPVSTREARAAARARVSADRKRGYGTPAWILELAASPAVEDRRDEEKST